MLRKKQPEEIDPVLIDGVNEVRKLLMNRGYFITDVIKYDKQSIDVIVIREELLQSEKLRVRVIVSGTGGLSIPPIQRFYQEQVKVFNLKGLMIALGPISNQAARYIEKRNLNVVGAEWLRNSTGTDLKKEKNTQKSV